MTSSGLPGSHRTAPFPAVIVPDLPFLSVMVCILAKDPVTAKSPAYHDHLLHRILLNLLNATLRPLTHSIFAASNTSSAMNADPLAFLQRERRQRSKAVGVPVTSTEHRFLAARSRAAMVGRERLHLLRNRRFADSPLEGGGFEPSVPRSGHRRLGRLICCRRAFRCRLFRLSGA